MSVETVSLTGWQLFWSNVMSVPALSLYILVAAATLLFGFAFHMASGALRITLRVLSAVAAAILAMGLLGALGIQLPSLSQTLDWLRMLTHAPIPGTETVL